MLRFLRGGRGREKPPSRELYMIYVDESGTPGHKGSRYYILLGLGIPLDHSYALNELGENLLEKLWKLGYDKRRHEIKGSEVFRLLKGHKDKYVAFLESVVSKLVDLEAFSIAVAIDKHAFNHEVLSKLEEYLDTTLSQPPSQYLNVFVVDSVRSTIIMSLRNYADDLIVRAQSLNELLFRVHKELESRDAQGIAIFDAEADSLARSAYKIYATALARDGLAFGMDVVRTDRIKDVKLGKSNLDFGIQLADLLVNSIYNCFEHGVREVYEILKPLLGDKGFVLLPKTAKPCM
ncbi:MAG: DUF3800 domain-containing protein [Desulfurococcales archaeon]|nr:DUF3800 domain-containing protein [Desulfurococcales archaeon]